MNSFITKANDLVTTHAQTRAGFIEAALEKNRKAQPFVEAARTLRVLALAAKTPMQLLDIPDVRPGLLAASGLSDKALNHFSTDDQRIAMEALIRQFLEPAGDNFVDELVYRFLLTKGDALGGSMRNYVGSVAKIKVTRKILSVLQALALPYSVLLKSNKTKNLWNNMNYSSDFSMASEIAAISWTYSGKTKVVFFDTKIPTVGNNVDICLYKGGCRDFNGGLIVNRDDLAIMLGELKGGIDPAGADEHWKTANTALQRIRTAFAPKPIMTSFVGAAIEYSMAKEIWEQLLTKKLSNAANLTVDEQFTEYCEWIVKL